MAAAAAVCIWLALDHFYQRNVHQLVADMERALYVESSGGPVTRHAEWIESNIWKQEHWVTPMQAVH